MHRILILILLFIFLILPSRADFIPFYHIQGAYYGSGLILIDDKVSIYETDSEESNVAGYIDISQKTPVIKIRGIRNPLEEDTFIARKFDDKLAVLPVEADTDDWFYVCYNQKNKLFGWIKKADNIDFISWQDFFNIYGRKNGIHIFRNLKEKYKKLYSAPNEDSTLVDDFFIAKHISLWLIKGDWMLVKVTTYDGITKTGWMRWRLENGELVAFPNFDSF